MMARRPTRRAYILTELLALLTVGMVLLTLLGKQTITVLRVQRLAAEHANRLAVMDSLTRQLTADARGVLTWELAGETLVLRVQRDAGPAEVRYTLATGRVQRSGAADDDRAWQAGRLTFGWRVEHGPRGSILWLDFTEQPPPQSLGLPQRTYSVATGLPRAAPTVASKPEESP